MKNILNKSTFLYLFAVLTFSFTYTSNFVEAQSSDSKPKKTIKYKKSRALSPKVSKKMIKVYEALEVVDEKGDPAPDMGTVIEILTELRNDAENLKSYDRSVVLNSWAYVYFSDEKYDLAMDAYKELLDEPEVTIPLRVSALLTLAQLNLIKENYQEGIALILQWMDEVE